MSDLAEVVLAQVERQQEEEDAAENASRALKIVCNGCTVKVSIRGGRGKYVVEHTVREIPPTKFDIDAEDEAIDFYYLMVGLHRDPGNNTNMEQFAVGFNDGQVVCALNVFHPRYLTARTPGLPTSITVEGLPEHHIKEALRRMFRLLKNAVNAG